MTNLQPIPRIHPYTIFLAILSFGHALFVFPESFIPKKNRPTTLFHSLIDLYRDLKKRNPSLLQHSFATHLLETEASTRLIKTLLGHGSSKTTEIYTQVSTQEIGEKNSFG